MTAIITAFFAGAIIGGLFVAGLAFEARKTAEVTAFQRGKVWGYARAREAFRLPPAPVPPAPPIPANSPTQEAA